MVGVDHDLPDLLSDSGAMNAKEFATACPTRRAKLLKPERWLVYSA